MYFALYAMTMGQDTLKIQSGGHFIYGVHYDGGSNEPMPSLLLLHGFPGGYGDVLDLGKRLSKDSINVFTLTLSGISISEGFYGDSSPIVDLRHTIDHLLQPENVAKYRIDTTNFLIGGWSFGGALSMIVGAEDARIDRIISIAGFNGAAFLDRCAENEDFKNLMLTVFMSYKLRGMVNFNPLRAFDDLDKHRHRFDPVRNAKIISKKPLLLFAGTDDAEVGLVDHIMPYYRAIRANRGRVNFHVFQTGHRFGGFQDRIAAIASRWIRRK